MHYLLKEVFYIYETRTNTDYIKYCFMKKIAIFLIGLAAAWLLPAKGQIVSENDTLPQGVYSDEQISEILRNMPNIEVGKGLTFKTKDDKYKLTLRLRMQSLAGITLNDQFSVTQTEACIKRLRLRFDGHVFSPKLTYSIQLGFSPYDAKLLGNGNMNIIRDAMVYYVPSANWNIGFGQTKIRGNRARMNSSSALQFVDRSIVNSEFNLDRDFGLFGEYFNHIGKTFQYAVKASITTGDGRNFRLSTNSGLAYTARVELFPLGRFKALGDVTEGDFEREETPKLMIAGAYSYNDRAARIQGENGDEFIDGNRRSLQSYFVDFIFKYNGFAFYTDFMGRICDKPLIYRDGFVEQNVYTGMGLNVQASYIFPKNWEIAARHSTLMPEAQVRPYVGYKTYNQATLGVTKYIIGHTLKVQADISYNYATEAIPAVFQYDRWQARIQIEVGI